MRKVDEITEADWDEVLAVNLKGPFLVTPRWDQWVSAQGAKRLSDAMEVSSAPGKGRTIAITKWLKM